MQKTRLDSDACQGIGDHWIDMAAEVKVEPVHPLAVVVVLTGRVMNGKERITGRTNSGEKNACALGL